VTDWRHRDKALALLETHRLLVADFDAPSIVQETVQQVAGRAMRQRLDFGARANPVMRDTGVGVDLDADRDVMVMMDDFEAFALVEVHDLVIADVMTLVALEVEQFPVLFVDESLDFGAGAGCVVDFVRMAVDFDLDMGVHRSLSLSVGRPGLSRNLAFTRGHRKGVERDTATPKFLAWSRTGCSAMLCRDEPLEQIG
jgi:hypothetical protein